MSECRAGAPVRNDAGLVLWTFECTLQGHALDGLLRPVHEARDVDETVLAWWPDGKEFRVADIRLEHADPPDPATVPAPAACASCRHWEPLTTRSDWQVDVPIRTEWLRDAQGRVLSMKEPEEWEARRVATERRYGVCTQIILRSGHVGGPVDEGDELVAAFTQDASAYRADLVTLDTFACALHEPAEAPGG